MASNSPNTQRILERRAKTIAQAAPALVKPALGDALFQLLEDGVEPSRAALITHFEAKLRQCPSITGETVQEQDLLRMTLEQTLAILQPK